MSREKHLSRLRGGIAVGVLFFVSVLLGRWAIALMGAWLFFHGAREFMAFFRKEKETESRNINETENYFPIEYFSAFLFFAAALSPAIFNLCFTAFCLLILSYPVFCEFAKERTISECLPKEQIALNILCLVYTGWLPAHFVLARYMRAGDLFNQAVSPLVIKYLYFLQEFLPDWFFGFFFQKGVFYCGMIALSICFNDIASYYGGKTYGKTKLTNISPKKTLEGSLWGMFVGVSFFVIFGTLCGSFFGLNIHSSSIKSWLLMVFIGVLINFAAQVGDLVESLIKRACKIKDSGTLIEGQGGVLDRFDSHIFAVATAFYCYAAFL